MSTLQTINVKHPSSASNNVVLDNSGNTTISGNATISGSATVGGVAVVTTTGTQTLTNKTLTSPVLTSPTISGTPVMSASVLTLMTAQASTSGTFIDFTGIPSWVRRITVMFNGVSTNGTSLVIVQIGSGSFTVSGYTSTTSTNGANANSTVGFLTSQNNAAVDARSGIMLISNVTGNVWVMGANIGVQSANSSTSSGVVTISGTLDRIRITTVNGTDTFDAGSINVLYE